MPDVRAGSNTRDALIRFTPCDAVLPGVCGALPHTVGMKSGLVYSAAHLE
jgi:hypothetical protein